MIRIKICLKIFEKLLNVVAIPSFIQFKGSCALMIYAIQIGETSFYSSSQLH